MVVYDLQSVKPPARFFRHLILHGYHMALALFLLVLCTALRRTFSYCFNLLNMFEVHHKVWSFATGNNLHLDVGVPISSLAVDILSERILPCPENMLYVPSYPHEHVAWGFLDRSLRLYSDRKALPFSLNIWRLSANFNSGVDGSVL